MSSDEELCECCRGVLEHSKEIETGICYSCAYINADDGGFDYDDPSEGYGADSEFNSSILGDC